MNSLQAKMFAEVKDQSLFKRAEAYGLQYLAQVFDRPVYPRPEDLANLDVFNEELPDATADAGQVLDQLHQYGSPATVAQLGGRYFGFVNGSVVPASLAAKNLAAYWDQNTAMQVLSPICSRLESVVQGWLVELMGLPPSTVAGFVSGTSMANFCGLAAARYRLLKNQGWDIGEQGLFGAPRLRVVTSRQAHSTALKAISLVGLGKANIEWVEVDKEGRIEVERIPELDSRTILILQAGNVNSGAFDDFARICEQARQQGSWIHIDGAFGLWAAATSQLKHLTTGYQWAHSWAVDGHKTLNTPYDSGIVLCADSEALVSALHMSGDYIIEGQERDGMYYTPEMSRRARIVELWACLRYLGKVGVDQLVGEMHQRARQFAGLLDQTDGFKVLNRVVFNQVLVRCATDELTERVIAGIQASGECWVGGSSWQGQRVIRISICSWATTAEDVVRSVRAFSAAYQETIA